MLGQLIIAVIAYVCSKYISTYWTGALKLSFGYSGSFMLAWLLGGLLVLFAASLFSSIDPKAIFTFFAQGFWWAMIGMLVGIYYGRKARKKRLKQGAQLPT